MLRAVWTLCVLIVATTAFALPLTVLTLLFPRWSDVTMRSGRIWSRIMLSVVGARVTYHGLQRATVSLPCIYIANHQSMIDIWVMFNVMPASARFVAKQELFRIPVFGWVLRTSGCIPIDRVNRSEAIRSLRMAAERIRAGSSVVLYPEGTRSQDGRLAPFKKGAFHLALQAGVPVVPVAITGSYDVMSPGSLRVRPGPVDVWVEPAIDPARYLPDDYDGLLEEVRAVIERRFQPPADHSKRGKVQLETG